MCHGTSHLVLQNEMRANVIFTDIKDQFSRDQIALETSDTLYKVERRVLSFFLLRNKILSGCLKINPFQFFK